jgi:acyl-CoA reductase-like NAD-dependent aldehyde dehydrogenase
VASTRTDLFVPMTIDGQPVDEEHHLEVVNPSTGQPTGSVPDCSPASLAAAVRGASVAFATWSREPLEVRRGLLLQLIDRIEANIDELAFLLTTENGKPLANAASEVRAALGHWRDYAQMAIEPEVLRDDDERRIVIRRVPIGVVGAITAWNYPVLLACFKVGPAILAGNTVILKPSPYTPLATLRFAQLVNEVLPPGVVQCVSGGDDLGRWIVSDPAIGKISFTGSVATGRAIMAGSAPTLKRLTLELGGNDPGIVLADVDLDRRADDLFWAAFSNAGQVCAGLKRLYVHEDRLDDVCSALASVASTVRVGDGFEPGVHTGPIQNRAQYQRVQELFRDAVANGAEVVFQGDVPDAAGYFFPITIVRGVAEGTRLVDEEPFGPIIPILSYTDIDDVVVRANATDYGLGASVWGEDLAAATEVAERLEAGSVWVNVHPSLSGTVPFGGRKQSGIGVEASVHGLQAYTDISVLHIKKN